MKKEEPSSQKPQKPGETISPNTVMGSSAETAVNRGWGGVLA